MEQYGNTTTFNIESVLHKNIKDGEYFNKTCVKLTTFAELVDEASAFPALPLTCWSRSHLAPPPGPLAASYPSACQVDPAMKRLTVGCVCRFTTR